MTTVTQSSSGRIVSNRVFNRPANLHLAWSASKEAAMLKSYRSPSSSVHSRFTDTRPITAAQPSTTKTFHPYSSFLPSSDDESASTDTPPTSSASTDYFPRPVETAAAALPSSSKSSLLKSGHLAWRSSTDKPSRRGALSGFEKALRRRQATKDCVPNKDPDVFVTLEQSVHSNHLVPNIKPWNLGSFPSEPFLASPDARDPSAFEADRLLSRPRPAGSEQSRWIAPSSWAVSATSPSQSVSTSSSSSVSPQTPKSSPPCTSEAGEILLSLYSQDSVKLRSTSRRNLQMQLRVTRSSTVEMQPCPSVATDDEAVQIRHKQLVITGEAVGLSRPGDLDLASPDPYSRRPTNAVCILSSANVTDLSEWQHAIEGAIDECRSAYRERFERRRSSATMLDTIAQFEQLQDRTREEWCMDTTTPMMGASSTLPTLEPPSTREAELLSPRGLPTGSDFSASAFIDYYASPTTTASTPYSFEDAYLSIIRRFADSELTSPLSAAARSERLDVDVPVSPCSFDFRDDQDAVPSSPLDPWMSHRPLKSIMSPASSTMYADDTVRQIFAEGFRC